MLKKVNILIAICLISIFSMSISASAAYMGDVDSNGKITASDARVILRAAAKIQSLDVSQTLIADINGDNKITASDARKVLRMSAKLEDLIEMPSEGGSTVQPPSSLTAVQIHDIASRYTVEVNAENDEYLSTGSGFFISDDGKVVTNYHVIDEMYEITVTDYNDNTYEVVSILAFDPDMDIAVLKVNADSIPADLNYDTPLTGSEAYTLGSSKGMTDTFSNGIISNGSRVVEEYNPNMTYIQTTAPISSGNSGGPLINDKAEVIGINTWERTDGQNLNFAIPVRYLDDLDYSNPMTMSEFAALFSPDVGPENPSGSLDLIVDTSVRYLDKGGTAIIDIEVEGDLGDRVLYVDYDSNTFRCEWEDDWFVSLDTGNDIAILYVSPLCYTSTTTIKVYIEGYEDSIYVDIPINASEDGWYDYGGYVGAVDYGAYTRVAPHFYYINDDATGCSFFYSLYDLFDAGYSEDVLLTGFFDYLGYYGYTYMEKEEFDSRTTYSFYNDEYEIAYSYSLIYDDYGSITDIMITFIGAY